MAINVDWSYIKTVIVQRKGHHDEIDIETSQDGETYYPYGDIQFINGIWNFRLTAPCLMTPQMASFVNDLLQEYMDKPIVR